MSYHFNPAEQVSMLHIPAPVYGVAPDDPRQFFYRVTSFDASSVFSSTALMLLNNNNKPLPPDPALVAFDGNEDPERPTNFAAWQKWTAVGVICSASLCVTCTSSIMASAYAGAAKEFDVSLEVAVLGVSLYVLGLGIGPRELENDPHPTLEHHTSVVLLARLSKFYGRNPIYMSSYGSYFGMSFLVAFSPTMGVFLVFRFLTGFAGSAFFSVAGGSIADLFTPQTIGFPTALYTLSALIGPVVGPLLEYQLVLYVKPGIPTGALAHPNLTGTFYLIIIWSFVKLLMLYLLVPEMHQGSVLRRKAVKLREDLKDPFLYALIEKDKRSVWRVMLQSLKVLFLLIAKECMALFLDIWTALLLGILYLFFEAIPITIEEKYGFDQQSSGLAFLGIGLGMIIGLATQPYWHSKYVNDVTVAGRAYPETRLPIVKAGALLVPLGLAWFAVTSYSQIHFMVPILGTLVFGIGCFFIFSGVFTFLVEAYRPYAASAMAGNSLIRCLFAAGFPFFAKQMYVSLGTVGATILLATLTLLMLPLP
ncbi:MFS general substrate transporter [Calocera viscosa TUFC12733]|uniref:MFS general substrate transporter n=1 Tax=Calocera viscosa (strain TUFC12733) TaxID=1330018 RepID=A0A167PEK1_CALVF|nr:MFS general substrate transporter [Calocera viscosa TUFC12733]